MSGADTSGSDKSWQLEPELISSRRALITVLAGLAEHRGALTVLGGHAVIEVTRHLPGLPPADTTRDGDVGVIPQLLGDLPRLGERLTELGYEAARPERPGVWSPIAQHDRDIHDRDSVDLIAPMSLARDGLVSNRPIRAARVGSHGEAAVSATRGAELSLIDRRLSTLRSFDGGTEVEAYVAGPTALLCAKAHKLHDRMDPNELRRNAQRLRPKDFADLYRLLLAISPERAAAVFARGAAEPRIASAVTRGYKYLLEILEDDANVAATVADVWADPDRTGEIRNTTRAWRTEFAS